jgi:cyclophilin family peptidyl-prolyl cis-trans isomerase
MPSPSRRFSQIEPLEARIAPAVVISNPLPDLSVGPGKTGASIDLSQLTQAATSSAYHTKVKFTTNVDMDAATPGIQAGEIVIELFDDAAPRTVQNFVSYVTNPNTNADYDGTIIHRSAALDGVGNPDIIQGGGFAFPGFGHIPTGPEVFNEYSPAHENVRGTIALAKTGLGPSTGTSEWYFNVVDNSSALNGSNNGGFTVFGQVVSGMDVVDKIASFTTKNFGGALSTLPLQDYTSGTPTADQVIRIVDAAVLPLAPAATSLTYSISHIYKVGANGLPTTVTSDAVKGTVAGSTLNLNYVPGKSGVADVVVKVSDGTDSVEETFRVDLRPNLFLIDTDTQLIVPGDSAPLKFKVINDGATAIAGTARIELFVQRTDVPGSPVVPVGVQMVPVSVAAGGAQVLTLKTPIPTKLATSPNETYQVTAKITKLAAERDGTDNTSSGGSHQLVNQFGNFQGRTNVMLKYQLNGGLVTWSMQGPGTGGLTPDATGNLTLEASGTTLATTLTALSSKTTARPSLTGIQFSSPVGIANLGTVDVSGLIAVSSGIKTLNLGNLTGDSLMLIGPVLPDNSVKAAITLKSVTDFSIESAMPIASLTVGGWTDTAGSVDDSILAPSLGALTVNGNFGANVTLFDDVPTASLKVTGRMDNATFHTAGNIGAISLGSISSSRILAGVDARPTSLSDVADARSITSFTITGAGSTNLFTDSLVAARTLGTIVVKGVTPGDTGSATDTGFIADSIVSYSRLGGPAKANMTTAQTFDDLGDYVVQVL